MVLLLTYIEMGGLQMLSSLWDLKMQLELPGQGFIFPNSGNVIEQFIHEANILHPFYNALSMIFRSLKRLSYGHTVYISGLTCSITKEKRWAHSNQAYPKLSPSKNFLPTFWNNSAFLFSSTICVNSITVVIQLCSLEVLWYENSAGASLVNLSALPAILNSSCLHKQTLLSDISTESSSTYVRASHFIEVIEVGRLEFHIFCCGSLPFATTLNLMTCMFIIVYWLWDKSRG